MICSLCGIDKREKDEQFFLSKNNIPICATCKGIRDSFKYYIGGKEISKEDYDKFLDEGIIPG